MGACSSAVSLRSIAFLAQVLQARCTRSILCLFMAAQLSASAAQGTESHLWSSWQIQEENDAVALSSGSDEHYTQGLLISLQRHPTHTPRWAEATGDRLGRLLYPARSFQTIFGVEFGQHLFTPESISIPTLIADDRPYAAWLYGGVLLTLTEEEAGTRPVQQLFELQFGVIGPAAGGEWVQSEFHQLIDSKPPLGWDNQLPNEPGLNLQYLWRQRIGSASLDLIPHWGLALGTVQVYANAGFTVRLGRNISGFPLLQNNNTVAPVPSSDRQPWEAYLFLGADGRLVAHNIFLDGSVFRDSHSIARRNSVYDLKVGLSVRYKSCRFNYAFVRRSQELETLSVLNQEGGDHDFGSVSFTVERKF